MSAGKSVAEAAASKAAGSSMNATGKGDDAWIHIQKKTFTNWVNVKLAETNAGKVVNVEDDFKTGIYLILMLEAASKKSLGKYNKAPKIPAQSLENIMIALAFIDKEGMKLVNIGPQDILAGNLKLILGLLWTIIYNYQVSKGFKEAAVPGAKKATAKDMLLEWVRKTIPEYNIQNFNKDWNDGRAVCALTNAVGGEPFLLPAHNQMPPGAGARNAKVGIDTAAEELGVPRLIAPEDLASPDIDDLSVVTYVSYFKDAKRIPKSAPLKPSEDNADDRAANTCKHPGCSARRRDPNTPFCPEHACGHTECADKSDPPSRGCPKHTCKHPAGCKEATQGAKTGCPAHACKHPDCTAPTTLINPSYCPEHGCQHPTGCSNPLPEGDKKAKFCPDHQCRTAMCREGRDGTDEMCPTHFRGKRAAAAPAAKKLPPWERAKDWRAYEGPDLGGRCKIRVFYSSTTSSQEIRRNTKNMMDMLERENVHKRPDFEPWIPVDVDMPTEKRNLIFEKAKTRVTPMLFIDDEYVGDWKKVEELNESGELTRMLEY